MSAVVPLPSRPVRVASLDAVSDLDATPAILAGPIAS
jgi:hypothetical protein